MQIIVMHARFTSAKSITLTSKHLILAIIAFLGLAAIFSFCIVWLMLSMGGGDSGPFKNLIPISANEPNAKDRYVKENINAMAVKLGEMQAQLIRLDALGERVQGLAGIKPEEFNFKQPPASGGEEVATAPKALSMEEFQAALDAMAKSVVQRSDYMDVVESKLISFQVQSKLLPTIQPVRVNYVASSFGWRFDPFTGNKAFHEGLDFPGPTGTPIVAAAGGVVIAAEYHPEFGNMVDIDHGGDITTKYAHASKIYVKVGDIVKRGQHIADIGSTGRSTGAHLHFEVHVKGVPQDPKKFLAAGANQASMAALVPK